MLLLPRSDVPSVRHSTDLGWSECPSRPSSSPGRAPAPLRARRSFSGTPPELRPGHLALFLAAGSHALADQISAPFGPQDGGVQPRRGRTQRSDWPRGFVVVVLGAHDRVTCAPTCGRREVFSSSGSEEPALRTQAQALCVCVWRESIWRASD